MKFRAIAKNASEVEIQEDNGKPIAKLDKGSDGRWWVYDLAFTFPANTYRSHIAARDRLYWLIGNYALTFAEIVPYHLPNGISVSPSDVMRDRK
jgi:hypothetical protein